MSTAATAPVARMPAGPKVREWARAKGFTPDLVARFVRIVEQASPGGHADVPVALDGLVRKPPQYVRANLVRITADELKRRLDAKGFQLARSDLDPNVFRIRTSPIGAGATVEHMQGMSTPQDIASASAPLALGARPGDVVADLAAAPGVKTIHIAGDLGVTGPPALNGGPWLEARGTLVAVEPDPDRMRALRFNLERAGIASAVLHQSTAQLVPGQAWADRVHVDAPCTGEGTIPKDRTRGREKLDEVPRLAALQSEILDAADRILKPGGRLVYATCTFGPEENEAQVQRLLARGYRMLDLPFDRVAGKPLGMAVTEWPGLELDPDIRKARRFFPGVHASLGFFVAALQKGGT